MTVSRRGFMTSIAVMYAALKTMSLSTVAPPPAIPAVVPPPVLPPDVLYDGISPRLFTVQFAHDTFEFRGIARSVNVHTPVDSLSIAEVSVTPIEAPRLLHREASAPLRLGVEVLVDGKRMGDVQGIRMPVMRRELIEIDCAQHSYSEYIPAAIPHYGDLDFEVVQQDVNIAAELFGMRLSDD